ncbi:MAG: acetamidase/formamidase family protein [Candidatus Bathyarchaeota archaeon]|nr:acetamidase/formamidase family protein [Candidatus Bathyarchaeota archaeon]MDH5745418.1 acetamidase/formamidase family protein [Candidatus Bathyarchaeota archaeon]
MKIVPRSKLIYSFSSQHKPVERVKPRELVLLETEDAFGGQVKNEETSLEEFDWSRVDGATGPVFVEDAELGDTLVAEILDIKVEEKGVIVTVPKNGILGRKRFNPSTKIVGIGSGYVHFDKNVRVKANPMIGTIGVAPESGEIPSSSLGKHGGNMDVKELTAGTKLYLPVFTEGALFAAGDLHAVQADGELCVSSVEVAGEVLLRFSLIKGKKPEWPILETHDWYAFLACGDTLDEAATFATDAAVDAFMRKYEWPFEKAYMFGSLAINLEINQVVDPKKGIRAVMSKDFMSLNSLLI